MPKTGGYLRQQDTVRRAKDLTRGGHPAMSVQVHREHRRAAPDRWGTIRYALNSTPRTVRLCVILLVAGTPAEVFAYLIRR
jgi:hypothetical protein